MDKDLNGEFDLSKLGEKSGKKEKLLELVKKDSHLHFYSSFSAYPKGIRFEDQRSGEEILLFLRRHFVTNVPWILLSLFLAVLPVFFPFFFADLPFPPPSPNVIALLLATYYLVIFGFVLLNFTLWYFHTGIVTNFRVIDIDITSILIREVAEAKNEDIQDVSYTQIGFVRSLFNYGDVHVQTSGSLQNVEFDRVPRPSVVARIIGDLNK